MKQRGKTVRFLLTVALIVLCGHFPVGQRPEPQRRRQQGHRHGRRLHRQADDFSAIFWNPAGAGPDEEPQHLALRHRPDPQRHLRLRRLRRRRQDQVSKMYPSGALGLLQAAIKDKLIIGIGVYTPSGTGANWDGEQLKTSRATTCLQLGKLPRRGHRLPGRRLQGQRPAVRRRHPQPELRHDEDQAPRRRPVQRET